MQGSLPCGASGRFRVIYEVHEDERRLMVLRVARRDERTYRRL